jgi:hypothetical protein
VFGEQDAMEDIFGPNGRKYSKMQKTAQYGVLTFVLRTKYHQSYQTRRMRWTGHVAHVREKRNAHKVLMWKRTAKREFARPRRTQEVNIEMDIKINRMKERAMD